MNFPGRRAGGSGEVFLLAYPTVITLFGYSLMGVADTMMVGRLGTRELAAVGLTSTIYMTIIAIPIETADIVNTFSAQAHGEGRLRECSRRAWQGMYIALLFWPLLVLCIIWLDELLGLLGPSAEVQAFGYEYGSIRLLGSGFLLLLIVLASFFRGVGMVKTPMFISLWANVLNVVLDYVLIFGKLGCPALGVEGAAWASNIALFCGALLLFLLFLRPGIHRRFSSRTTFGLDLGLIRRMLRTGLPAGLQFFVDIASFTVFMTLIGRMGDTALAASQIALQVMALSFNTCWGFSVATTTLVGQYIGAGNLRIASRAAASAARMVMIYTLALAALLALAPEQLVRLFSADESVQAYGVLLLNLAVLFMVFDGLGMIAVGALRGAGDTRWPMVIAFFGAWGLFLPLAYLFGVRLAGGVLGAWVGCSIYIVIVANAYIQRYRSGAWKTMKV